MPPIKADIEMCLWQLYLLWKKCFISIFAIFQHTFINSTNVQKITSNSITNCFSSRDLICFLNFLSVDNVLEPKNCPYRGTNSQPRAQLINVPSRVWYHSAIKAGALLTATLRTYWIQLVAFFYSRQNCKWIEEAR